MNEFIEFRNHIYDDESNYVYPLQFLDAYINRTKAADLNERRLIRQIRTIKQLEQKKKLGEKEIDELLSFLGEHSTIDRFIVDTVIKLFNDETKQIIENKTKEILGEQQYDNQKLYHVLDICIECSIDILSDGDILLMLQKYKHDLEVISILMDYMDRFNRQGFQGHLSALLAIDYPDSIKIQTVNVLRKLHPQAMVDQSFLEKNKVFFEGFTDFLHADHKVERPGISILQSMFYGDFEDSGKGNNGGLAVLLKGLGEEISKDRRVSYVFTITITQELTKPFISFHGNNHVLIRLPIYLDPGVRDKFIKRELFIKRQIAHFLKQANIEPDVFHIRFLDNASKAVAHLCKELNRKLVFTLTPDPHRNMFDGKGQLKELSFDELLEKLNKIKIGDELIDKSDGIVGIGNAEVKTELEVYFPQFKDERVNRKIKMIGEGIQTDKSDDVEEVADYSNSLAEWYEANGAFFDRPVILNVGRISVLKGQMELLKAWSNSRLSETHNLLIIGGDLERPNLEEETMIDFFKEYLQRHPQFKDRFMHKGAMSNVDVKLLERKIMQRDFDYPHIYLCSSVKEEFGIAILEAMSNGFLILGPIKGGVKSYIRNGQNGFLIDTSNWETIAKEAEKHIYDPEIDKKEVRKIQAAGRKTVDDNFSIKKISNEFVSFYLSLKGEEDHEI